MDDQNRNLLLATALSFLVIMIWFVVFPPEEPAPPADPAVATDAQPALPPAAATPGAQPSAAPVESGSSTAEALPEETPRAAIETPRLAGTISLTGGRLDDLTMKD